MNLVYEVLDPLRQVGVMFSLRLRSHLLSQVGCEVIYYRKLVAKSFIIASWCIFTVVAKSFIIASRLRSILLSQVGVMCLL